jgi:bacillithiol biosynthesis deacetylase BshB1
MKVDILAVGVHPDDIELSCSGTLLAHLESGYRVGLLDLTQGELGSRGSREIRAAEAAEAAEKMGASFRWNLGLPDGFFQNNEETMMQVIRAIRRSQPEIVLANALEDRHPDHGRAAKLVADSCFYAGLIKIVTLDEQGNQQAQWRPKALYHYIQDRDLTPDFVVDISRFLEEKMELVRTFRSQFYQGENEAFQQEVSTPISGRDFMEFLRAKNRAFGRRAGFEYAEGFNYHRTIGIRNLFHLE